MSSPIHSALSSPTARHIADVLADRILSGRYPAGQRLPSERALADELAVSRVIIRAAVQEIAHRQLVVCSAHCRPLVRAQPPAPGAPSMGRRSVALWLWPHPTWPGVSMIMRGVRQALHEDDFRLLLECAHGEDWGDILASEARFLRRLAREGDAEGVILWYLGGGRNLAALEAVRAAGIPMVFLDRRPPAGFHAPYVGVDNARAAEQAVRHLLSLGHRRVAHVTNMDTTASTVAERLAGYRRALERAKIPFRPELVAADSGHSEAAPSDATDAFLDVLLGLPDPPTAFFAVNDHVALRLIDALRARGLRVPEDAAVAGFDGVERWSPGAAFLTTLAQPFERMGAQAVELLEERVTGGPTTPIKHVILEPTLFVGASTRPTLPVSPRTPLSPATDEGEIPRVGDATRENAANRREDPRAHNAS